MRAYSNSSLNLFERCPRAYKFRYIDKAEARRAEGASSFLGSRVHEVLELLHKDLKNGKRNSLEDLLDYYTSAWRENWSSSIQIPEGGYSPENHKKVGEECIRNYYEKHRPFDRGRTIGTEIWLRFSVGFEDIEHDFSGKIDRLTLLPGGLYEVHDYKTSKFFPTKGEINQDRQLGLYQLAVQQNYPDADDVELVWHYVRFGKDVRSRRTRGDLEELEREIVEIIERIKRAEEEENFPTMRDEGARCDWCDYQHLCPEWNHLYETESLPENEFLNEEGVVLVDELSDVDRKLKDLKEKKLELREKKKNLEEAILDYAGREGISAVYGTEKRASIESRERIKFPTKNEKGRDKLEKTIRESGRWNEVATLQLASLKRIVRREEWPEELLEELEEFKKIEKSSRIKLEEMRED